MSEKLMLVGEVAKRLNVTVRTLQYYDREKLCSPSAFSDGGRRLYSDRDLVRLHQIFAMKYLGFSLEQIKNNLPKLSSVSEVVELLKAQERQLLEQIENLTKAKEATSLLLDEVIIIDKVDWRKYATIVDLIRANNMNYWVVKHFDEKTLQKVLTTFDEKAAEAFMKDMEGIWDSFGELLDKNISPDCNESIALAKEMWGMIMKFSGGDNEVLQDVFAFGENNKNWKDENLKNKWTKIQEYLVLALQEYFKKNNIEVKHDGNISK